MKTPLRSLTLTSCLTAVFAVFVVVAPVGAQDDELARKSEQEQIKRMETSLALSNILDEAGQLARAQDYAKARTRYSSVLDQSANNPSLGEINTRARKDLAVVAAAQARQEEGKKSWKQARVYWQEAQSLDPDNKVYSAGLKGVDEKDPPLSRKYPNNPAATEELQDKVSTIQKLLYEGDSFHETGQYQRAVGRYKEILSIDPHNKVARLRIEKTEKTKERAATMRYEAIRQKRIGEVDESYGTPPIARRQVESGIKTTGVNESQVARMFDKLEKIIIPELNFTEVDVVDAIKYLQDQSKALDPEKTGVNFVLKVNPTSSPTAPAPGEAPAAPVIQRTLTLNLRQVPLLEVLRFITNLTNLQFKVEEYSVYIFPNTETSDVQVVRSFPVPPSFFSVKPVATGGTASTGAETVSFVTADVKKELEDKGVKFPQGASASYLTKSAKLIVKNTLDQINLIEQLLQEQSDVTTQIEIETKFIDFTEDQFKEFAFNYRLAFETDPTLIGSEFPIDNTAFLNGTHVPGVSGVTAETNLRNGAALPNSNIDTLLNPNAGLNTNTFSVTGILMGQGFQMVMRAINATKGADLMSSPKVTVVNGQKTKIRVVREFIYPTEYEAPEITTTTFTAIGGGSVSVISVSPSNPSDFKTRDVGVIMEVKADATKDRRIDLDLTPEVTEFQGFINYGQNPREAGPNTEDNPEGTVIAEGIALTPVFQIRKVQTKLQVIDGQTVVMGGFIRNDTVAVEDKVPLLGDIPLLGRLFRSKADRDVKRNLILFTTARIVNPNGTPKFLTDSEADALETVAVPVSAKTP